MDELDFGFNGNTTSNEETVNEKTTETVQDIETEKEVNINNGEEVTDINNQDTSKETQEEKDNKETSEKETKKESNEVLEAGTIVEYGKDKYTVDNSGNLIDKDGNVFKEAKDVKSWIDSLEVEDEQKETIPVDISAVQKAIGIEITDENNKPIEFESTPEGLASYVNAVIDNSKKQVAEDTIDALYSKYPILENVINYYVANGNSLEGFNEVKDRSTIQLDVNNEAQCEAIIREAWKEDGRKGNLDNYIQYLKSQNLLGVTAEDELNALIAKDKENADKLAKEAEEREQKYIEDQKQYWGDINKRINTDKRIGQYQIPDTIIRVHNGQRVSATPQDFFNYIYQVDKNGRSAYVNDLIRESKENPEARIIDDMIAAYLKFTGGNYESLVKMAINEEKVKTIKIKSATAKKPSVKINTPSNKPKTIDFGY